MGAPHAGSFYDQLETLQVGESIWLEAPDVKAATTIQRRATAASRYPRDMMWRRFSSSAYTAVSAGSLGDVRFVVRIERIQ